MRPYEVMVIFDADLEEETIRSAVDRYTQLIQSKGAELGPVATLRGLGADRHGQTPSPERPEQHAPGPRERRDRNGGHTLLVGSVPIGP